MGPRRPRLRRPLPRLPPVASPPPRPCPALSAAPRHSPPASFCPPAQIPTPDPRSPCSSTSPPILARIRTRFAARRRPAEDREACPTASHRPRSVRARARAHLPAPACAKRPTYRARSPHASGAPQHPGRQNAKRAQAPGGGGNDHATCPRSILIMAWTDNCPERRPDLATASVQSTSAAGTVRTCLVRAPYARPVFPPPIPGRLPALVHAGPEPARALHAIVADAGARARAWAALSARTRARPACLARMRMRNALRHFASPGAPSTPRRPFLGLSPGARAARRLSSAVAPSPRRRMGPASVAQRAAYAAQRAQGRADGALEPVRTRAASRARCQGRVKTASPARHSTFNRYPLVGNAPTATSWARPARAAPVAFWRVRCAGAGSTPTPLRVPVARAGA